MPLIAFSSTLVTAGELTRPDSSGKLRIGGSDFSRPLGQN